MLIFFGLSPSDVTSALSTRVVDEMETFPIDAEDVAAFVGVFRWTEGFLTWVLFIDGFKVGSMSVTKGNEENTKSYLGVSEILHLLAKFLLQGPRMTEREPKLDCSTI